MDFSTRLRGINPTNTVFYSPQPRAEVYCLLMNFKISKLAYCAIVITLQLSHLAGILKCVQRWVCTPLNKKHRIKYLRLYVQVVIKYANFKLLF